MASMFPSNPTEGQIFTGANGAVWKYTAMRWTRAGVAASAVAINTVGSLSATTVQQALEALYARLS